MERIEKGSCHCGLVRFEAKMDLSDGVTRCNCSICMKTMITGKRVNPDELRVVSGEEHLGKYIWGRKVATRYFCKECGVHVFGRGHVEALGGDFASVNVSCLDDVDVNLLPLTHWDGRHNNWVAGARDTPWPVKAA